MTARALLLLAASVGGFQLAACTGEDTGIASEPAAGARQLNVFVVSFDALRPDALGLYGYPKRTSPRLDAFAREAIVFENAYSVAPRTPASFAAAFTGRYPTRSFRGWRLREKSTLAQRFTDAGYRTAAFSTTLSLLGSEASLRGSNTT